MERTDEEFDRMIRVDVFNDLSKTFNAFVEKLSLTPMNYDERLEKILRKKAQITKEVICAYIDHQVDGYSKTTVDLKRF